MAGVCSCTSQNCTICFARVDGALYGFVLILSTIAFLINFLYSTGNAESHHFLLEEKHIGYSTYLVIVIVLSSFGIIFAWVLGHSAEKRNHTGCIIWLIISVVLFVLHIASWFVTISQTSSGFEFYLSSIGLLYRFFELVVVFGFVRELGEPSVPSVVYYADEGV